MIGTVRAYIHQKLTPMLADKVAEGNFASVLKWVRKPIASTESWAVYNNIFRIIALHGSDRDDWVTELGFLNADNKLDVFGQDEKNYIFLYMLDRLFGEIDIYPRIKLSKVSEATRQYYPIDTKSAKFEKYFPLPRPLKRRLPLTNGYVMGRIWTTTYSDVRLTYEAPNICVKKGFWFLTR